MTGELGQPLDGERAALVVTGDALPDFDDPHSLLRAAGDADPIPGAPMIIRRRDGSELEIEPGAWAIYADRKTRLPPLCPVIPLGKDGGDCYFMDTLGSVVVLKDTASGKGPIGNLFAGRSRYLRWAWPRMSKKSAEHPNGRNVGWEADEARQALQDACAYMGPFSVEKKVRGRGAWRASDGRLILHCGDAVLINGQWRPCGMHDGLIYVARERIQRPTSRPHPGGPGSSGDQLAEILRTFSWQRGEFDARLMLGWLMTAKMGGALDQRPAVFVTGGEGSGKSTLHGVLRSCMGGGLIATSNTTPAGIYQALEQDSVAILVDELEAKEDTRTTDRIVELARITYSGDALHRGSDGGRARSFNLFSSFLASAISKPALDAQDASRMVTLTLKRRDHAGDRLAIKDAELERIGRDLLRRILDWWEHWPRLLAIFRRLMIDLGHNDRACDTFSPLLAGYHMAVRDTLPDDAELAEWRQWLNPKTLIEVASRLETWERCAEHLLAARPEALRLETHRSVGSALAVWRDDPSGDHLASLRRVCRLVGLALIFPKDAPATWENAALFVPARSPAVHGLFVGTPFGGRLTTAGGWADVLRQAPQELWAPATCRTGYVTATKGVKLHLAAIFGRNEKDETDEAAQV